MSVAVLQPKRRDIPEAAKTPSADRMGDFNLLHSFFTLKNPLELEKFLSVYSELVGYLLEAHRQIKRVFGKNALEICLEYDNDPDEDFEAVFVTVKTDLSPEASLDLLDRFDEDWFLDNITAEISSKLTVNVRPI